MTCDANKIWASFDLYVRAVSPSPTTTICTHLSVKKNATLMYAHGNALPIYQYKTWHFLAMQIKLVDSVAIKLIQTTKIYRIISLVLSL